MMPSPFRIFIGWDAAQERAWNVAAHSARTLSSVPIQIHALVIDELRAVSLYTRPTRREGAGYWDEISDAPMATGHAISRFLVPYLCGYDGWALFTDGDVLFREDVAQIVALADPEKAVQVVQHDHQPIGNVKMDGQTQTRYARKNWSSVMLFNCGHPANSALTLELVNTIPGRDLHRFCWLSDALIGALSARWNVLIGEQAHSDPAIAHFTLGVPDVQGYDKQPFADEWFATALACGHAVGVRA